MPSDFTFGKWYAFPDKNLLRLGEIEHFVEPKTMELLIILAQANGELVSREKIQEALWHGRFVADHSLYNLVALLRKALGDEPENPKFIGTQPKKGYRLIPSVEWIDATKSPQQNRTLNDGGNAKSSGMRKPNNLKSWFVAVSLFFSVLFIILFIQQTNIQEPIEKVSNTLDSSIAVLPFDIFDGQKSTEYFADGLVEEIIHQLTIVPDMKVISRTSSFAFKDNRADIREIGKKLDVSYIMEGSVRKEQDQLRITIQLINANDGSHLWSKVFSSSSDESFILQEKISNAVVGSISHGKISITPSNSRIHPDSGEAYTHFIIGNVLRAKGTLEGYKASMEEFQKAVALRPDYALAHAGIAFNHLMYWKLKVVELSDAGAKANTAINTALEINPKLAEAYAARGLYFTYADQYVSAEKAYKKALAINPKLTIALVNYAYMFTRQLREEKALALFQRVLELDPLSPYGNWSMANILAKLGQFEKAEKQFERCLYLLPKNSGCGMGLANIYRLTNQNNKANKLMVNLDEFVSANNNFMINAKAVQHLWNDEAETTEKMLEERQKKVGFTYANIETLTMAKIRLGKLQDWSNELEAEYSRKSYVYRVNLNLALSAYYANNCSRSIEMYEHEYARYPTLHSNYFQMASGISYNANMAVCYKQLEQTQKLQASLVKLKKQLANFDSGLLKVPGLMLVQAKYALLVGEVKESQKLRQEIIDLKWPLAWMMELDPVFN